MEAAADTPKPNGEALAKEGTKWLERIRAAEKREEDWRKDATAAEKAFTNDAKGDEGKLYDFNILHSNVETIVPAIYNSTPIPDIRPRWTEDIGEAPQPPQQPQEQPGQPVDPRAMMQAQQEMLAFQQAMRAHQAKVQRDKDAKSFGDMIERVIANEIDDNRLDTEIEAEAQDAFLAGRGIVRVRFDAIFGEGDVAQNESLETEAVSWRDFRMGPAKRWNKVPWVAFRHTASRETLEAKVIDRDLYEAQAGADVPTTGPENDEDDIPYWEIWCRESKKVKFVRENDGRIMKHTDDPLGLSGFFPMPPPVQPITLTGKMTPVCPFTIYKKLADELDSITKRINKIMQGLKVRGIIAGEASKLTSLAEADDNEIRVETDLEGLAQTGGLEKAIMWWPVDKAIQVLKELYVQRESVKSSIYEITGISDIVRGASNANETLGAQEIKTRWGALRIQKMQRLIERQVRDVFVIMAELIATKFSEPTLHQMTGIEITDGMRAMMQNPVLAAYRVDVESDSTVRADLTRQKEDMSEFLAGTGNFFGTMGPLIQQAPEMAEPVAEIYASMASVFKLGRSAEDALERMKQMAKQAAKNPPPPDPEQAKAQAEMEMKKADATAKAEDRKAEMEMKREEHGFKMQEMKGEAIARAQEFRAKQADRQAQNDANEEKRGFEREKAGFARDQHEQKMQERSNEANAKRTEAGLPGDEAWGGMLDALTKLVEVVAQGQVQIAEGQEKIAEAVTAMEKAHSAPKRIRKHPDGSYASEMVQ